MAKSSTHQKPVQKTKGDKNKVVKPKISAEEVSTATKQKVVAQTTAEKPVPKKSKPQQESKKLPGLLKKSKSIKKVNSKVVSEKKAKAKLLVKPKVSNYSEFVNAENQAYNQLRKKTIARIKLDKE